MIICSCNFIKQSEIEEAIHGFLETQIDLMEKIGEEKYGMLNAASAVETE